MSYPYGQQTPPSPIPPNLAPRLTGQPSVPVPAPRAGTPRTLGILAGVLMLLLGIGATVFFLVEGAANAIHEKEPAPFDGALGSAAEFRVGADAWSVAVTKATWFDAPCTAQSSVHRLAAAIEAGRLLVLDVTFSVDDGHASFDEVHDFGFVDADGMAGQRSADSGCAQPFRGSTIGIAAGRVLHGQLAFTVASGKGGTVTYGRAGDLTCAAWPVPS